MVRRQEEEEEEKKINEEEGLKKDCSTWQVARKHTHTHTHIELELELEHRVKRSVSRREEGLRKD